MKHSALLAATPASSQPKPGMSAEAAFRRVSEHIMAGMDTPCTGAIDMAKARLQYRHDPAFKTLAHDIVAVQDEEIAFMRRWQMQHGGKPTP